MFEWIDLNLNYKKKSPFKVIKFEGLGGRGKSLFFTNKSYFIGFLLSYKMLLKDFRNSK